MNAEDIALDCRGVHHWFGRKKVLFDVNLRLRRGQFLGLVGPSGCGKSTLLRGIIGTHLPRQGQILIHTSRGTQGLVPVVGPGRDRGIVYQHYTLMPFLTALENVAIGLMLDQTSIPLRWLAFPKWRRRRREHLRMAAEFLEKVRLGDAMNLYPHELSGGMKQRVAIARALVHEPQILLCDEPTSALDHTTGMRILELMKEMNQRRGTTLIVVTHDERIFQYAHRIAHMDDGRVDKIYLPQEVG